MSTGQIEITGLAKSGGPLTKRIHLGDDGKLISDGSACVMSHGTACRVRFDCLDGFANYIGKLSPNHAIALGALGPDLPDNVGITTKGKLAGAAQPDLITRTRDQIFYQPGRPAFALLDYDTKGMPTTVKARLDELGGYLPALTSILPNLMTVGRVTRRSTSAGLYRTDTRTALLGSNGLHVFVLVQDGSDAERFLRTLHDRCWLAGLGWLNVGAAGQLLERSIVDRMVGGGERLVF